MNVNSSEILIGLILCHWFMVYGIVMWRLISSLGVCHVKIDKFIESLSDQNCLKEETLDPPHFILLLNSDLSENATWICQITMIVSEIKARLAQTRPLAGRIFWHPFFSSRLGWPISPDPKWPFSGTPTPTGYPGGVTFAPNMAQNRVRKSCSTNLSRWKIFKFLLAGEWFWGNYQPQIIKKCHIPRFRGRWAVSFRAFFKNF